MVYDLFSPITKIKKYEKEEPVEFRCHFTPDLGALHLRDKPLILQLQPGVSFDKRFSIVTDVELK